MGFHPLHGINSAHVLQKGPCLGYHSWAPRKMGLSGLSRREPALPHRGPGRGHGNLAGPYLACGLSHPQGCQLSALSSWISWGSSVLLDVAG